MDSRTPYVAVTRRSYEAAAEEYAVATDDYAAFPGLETEVERFVAEVPDGVLLDLGAGAGRDVRMLRRSKTVIAGDLCLPFLRRIGRGAAVQLDARFLPFRSQTFAGVWCAAVLLHLTTKDANAALREVSRVLIPGGRLEVSVKEGSGEPGFEAAVGMGPRWFTYFTKEQLVSMTREAGLAVEDVARRQTERAVWLTVRATRRSDQ